MMFITACLTCLVVGTLIGASIGYCFGEAVGREQEQDRAFRAWHRERDTNAEVRSLWSHGNEQ